jgi:hypothetical protein
MFLESIPVFIHLLCCLYDFHSVYFSVRISCIENMLFFMWVCVACGVTHVYILPTLYEMWRGFVCVLERAIFAFTFVYSSIGKFICCLLL